VPADTAGRVNAARRAGRRIVAVGTTVVRALETVTDEHGTTSPGEGWTSLVITRERSLRSVNGLVTGLHDPRATHLIVLERVAAAAAGNAASERGEFRAACHLERAYAAARAMGYLWHEFGDSHLIMGRRTAGGGRRAEEGQCSNHTAEGFRGAGAKANGWPRTAEARQAPRGRERRRP